MLHKVMNCRTRSVHTKSCGNDYGCSPLTIPNTLQISNIHLVFPEITSDHLIFSLPSVDSDSPTSGSIVFVLSQKTVLSIHVELGGDLEFRSTDANHTLKLKFFRVFWARFKSNSWHSTRPKAINETGKQIRCVKRTGTTKNRTQHWNC